MGVKAQGGWRRTGGAQGGASRQAAGGRRGGAARAAHVGGGEVAALQVLLGEVLALDVRLAKLQGGAHAKLAARGGLEPGGIRRQAGRRERVPAHSAHSSRQQASGSRH